MVASPLSAAPGGCLGVDGVGLATAPAGLAVRPVDLEDLDTGLTEVASQAGPVGAGPFDAHLGDLAERAHPIEQLAVASGRGREALRVEDLAPLVDDSCDVDVFVRVHPADDNFRLTWHAGTCLPLIRWVCWHHRPGRRTGLSRWSQGSYQVTSVRPAGARLGAGTEPTDQRQGTRPVTHLGSGPAPALPDAHQRHEHVLWGARGWLGDFHRIHRRPPPPPGPPSPATTTDLLHTPTS